MTSYVQGIDYGPRKGTLGISIHMSEGGDGLVSYLSRHVGEELWEWAQRVNGVSCNAALLSNGMIVQMLNWSHASGNLNPDDRAAEYGYYGGHHLRDVLGSHWPDPNTWTVSMEIAGFRADGPTDRQRDAAIRWGREMRAMFPTIRGATGHHDQSPKPCPGLTPNMKAIFAGIGGHGLWIPLPDSSTEEPVRTFKGVNAARTGVIKISGDDHWYLDLATNKLAKVGTAAAFNGTAGRRAYGPVTLVGTGPAIGLSGYVFGDTAAYVQAQDVATWTPDAADTKHTITVQDNGVEKARFSA